MAFDDFDLSGYDESRLDESEDYYEDDESFAVPLEKELDKNYLNLILNPDLRELELYIRGLEHIKVYDPSLNKEVIKIRKIKDHFLNENGINIILQELKLHTSKDIILQRISEADYRFKMHEIGETFLKLIFSNLQSFGMDTLEKQRSARRLWLAIKNKIDSAYSRAIGGKENDLSRARIELRGEIDGLNNIPNYVNPRDKKDLGEMRV